jgi:hypothetical protein
MTSTSESHNVLKTDARGRVRVPVERREALLDEFERSGLSGVKFAELVGVKYPTFALWAQKRRKARADGPAEARVEPTRPSRPQALRFFEAIAEAPEEGVATMGLVIELPGGAKVRLESPAQLRITAELLQLLGKKGEHPC